MLRGGIPLLENAVFIAGRACGLTERQTTTMWYDTAFVPYARAYNSWRLKESQEIPSATTISPRLTSTVSAR